MNKDSTPSPISALLLGQATVKEEIKDVVDDSNSLQQQQQFQHFQQQKQQQLQQQQQQQQQMLLLSTSPVVTRRRPYVRSSARNQVETCVCEVCQGELQRFEVLLQHKLLHFNSSHVCYVCDSYFISVEDLLLHMTGVHRDIIGSYPKGDAFVCPVCVQRFSSSKSLLNHQALHSPNMTKEDFTCTICSCDLHSCRGLLAHLNSSKHKEMKVKMQSIFICIDCRSVFANRDSYAFHMMMRAQNEVCDAPTNAKNKNNGSVNETSSDNNNNSNNNNNGGNSISSVVANRSIKLSPFDEDKEIEQVFKTTQQQQPLQQTQSQQAKQVQQVSNQGSLNHNHIYKSSPKYQDKQSKSVSPIYEDNRQNIYQQQQQQFMLHQQLSEMQRKQYNQPIFSKDASSHFNAQQRVKHDQLKLQQQQQENFQNRQQHQQTFQYSNQQQQHQQQQPTIPNFQHQNLLEDLIKWNTLGLFTNFFNYPQIMAMIADRNASNNNNNNFNNNVNNKVDNNSNNNNNSSCTTDINATTVTSTINTSITNVSTVNSYSSDVSSKIPSSSYNNNHSKTCNDNNWKNIKKDYIAEDNVNNHHYNDKKTKMYLSKTRDELTKEEETHWRKSFKRKLENNDASDEDCSENNDDSNNANNCNNDYKNSQDDISKNTTFQPNNLKPMVVAQKKLKLTNQNNNKNENNKMYGKNALPINSEIISNNLKSKYLFNDDNFFSTITDNVVNKNKLTKSYSVECLYKLKDDQLDCQRPSSDQPEQFIKSTKLDDETNFERWDVKKKQEFNFNKLCANNENKIPFLRESSKIGIEQISNKVKQRNRVDDDNEDGEFCDDSDQNINDKKSINNEVNKILMSPLVMPFLHASSTSSSSSSMLQSYKNPLPSDIYMLYMNKLAGHHFDHHGSAVASQHHHNINNNNVPFQMFSQKFFNQDNKSNGAKIDDPQNDPQFKQQQQHNFSRFSSPAIGHHNSIINQSFDSKDNDQESIVTVNNCESIKHYDYCCNKFHKRKHGSVKNKFSKHEQQDNDKNIVDNDNKDNITNQTNNNDNKDDDEDDDNSWKNNKNDDDDDDEDTIMNFVRKNSNKLSMCTHCELIFSDRCAYYLHLGLHNINNPWQCNLCGVTCTDKRTFATHVMHY